MRLGWPEQSKNTQPFRFGQISRYDEQDLGRYGRYWNNIHTGEHTGTHLDKWKHWATDKDWLH